MPKIKTLVSINAQGRRIGDTHHRARHTEAVIVKLWALRAKGYGYRTISAMLALPAAAEVLAAIVASGAKDTRTEVPWTTVRDICKGKTRSQRAARFKPAGESLPRRPPHDPRPPRVIVPRADWWRR